MNNWYDIFGQLSGIPGAFPVPEADQLESDHLRGMEMTEEELARLNQFDEGAIQTYEGPMNFQSASPMMMPISEFGNEPMRRAPAPPVEQPLPRLAMPTQETHTELPLTLDERVNPPTPTEQQGLEAGVIWNMRHDPLALSGYRAGAIDWASDLSPRSQEAGAAMEYLPPNWVSDDGSPGTPNTIVISQPRVMGRQITDYRSPTDFRMTDILEPSLTGRPYFNDLTRHEFRHRGAFNLADAAAANNVPLDTFGIDYTNMQPNPGVTNVQGIYGPSSLHERMTIAGDRAQGDTGTYQGVEIGPFEQILYTALLNRLNAAADQVNARRVQQLYANPGTTWSDIVSRERAP